jgi:hypothetical protein
LNTQDFWFCLKGIGERNLSLAQPHRIFVLVKGDWLKESQFSPTTQDFQFWLKGIGEMNLSLAQTHRISVLVKGDRQKGSQFSPTTHRTLGPVEVLGQPNFEKTNFIYLYNTYYEKSLLCKHCKESGNCCNPFLGPHLKMRKYKKKCLKKPKK